MDKEQLEELLNYYGVTYTITLADKLLEVIEAEKKKAKAEIVEKWQRMSNIGFSDYMRDLKEQKK